MSFRRRDAGLSLIQLAVVLGIVGVIVAAIWVSYGAVGESRRVVRAAEILSYVSEKIRYSAGQRGIDTSASSTALTLAMCQLGAFPADTVVTCNVGSNTLDLRHPWGGALLIEPSSASDRYFVRFNNVPKKSCVNLVLRSKALPAATGFINFNTSVGTILAANLNLSQANTYCVDNGYMRFELQLSYSAS